MAINWIEKIKKAEEEEEKKRQAKVVENTTKIATPRTVTLPTASKEKSVLRLEAEKKELQSDIEARRAKLEAQRQERARKEQDAYNNVKKLESEYNTTYKWLLQNSNKNTEEYSAKVKEMNQKSNAYKEALKKYNEDYAQEAKARLSKSNKESFNNVVETGEKVLATGADAIVNPVQGFLNIPEYLADFATHSIAQAYDNAGNTEEAERLRRNAQVNITQDNWLGETHKYLDEKSYIPEVGDEILQGVGYSATLAGLNLIPGAGKAISDATLVASSMGSSLNEAYSNPDVNDVKAWTKAGFSAGLELGVEKLFGVLGYGGSSVDDMLLKSTDNIKNGLAKAITQTGITMTGEGVEEMLSYAGNYLIDHGLDLIDDSSKLGQEWDNQEFWKNFFVGAMSAGISQGPANIVNNSKQKKANSTQEILPSAKETETNNVEVLPTAKEEETKQKLKQEVQTTLPTANTQPVVGEAEIANYVNEKNIAPQIKDRMQSVVSSTNKISNSDVQLQFSSLDGDKKAQTDGNTITVDISKASLGDVIHEITHNTETSKGYIAVSDYILTELDKRGELQGIKDEITSIYSPVYEQEGRTFTEQDLESEIVAKYTEQFASDENFVNKITQEDRNFAQKIYDWIKEKVNYYRTVKNMTNEQRAQYDELRKAEKLWLKALQSDNIASKNDTRYSFIGQKGMRNYSQNRYGDNGIQSLFNTAREMRALGVDNEKIRQSTNWFQDKNGDWKFEFSDKDMSLRSDIKLQENGTYKLGEILQHDTLFMAYPELANYDIRFEKMNAKKGGGFNKNIKQIRINSNKFNQKNWKLDIESTLVHEIQHAIQNIEEFEGGTSSAISRKAYYTSLGEIESTDAKRRFLAERNDNKDIKVIPPESSKANPKHKNYDNYMKNRNIIDKVKDSVYNFFKERGENNDVSEEYNIQNKEQNNQLVDGGKRRRYVDNTLATSKNNQAPRYSIDKENKNENNNTNIQKNRREDSRLVVGRKSVNKQDLELDESSSFSMPNNKKNKYSISTDNKGRELTKEQQEYFKNSKVRDENGNLKVYYHGTKRADRVGNLFDPNRATSGPMAFFTDSKEIADNYSKGKQDTSLTREYDTEYDLFKINDKTLDEYWNSLTRQQQAEIVKRGNDIGFDDDFENIVYGENASENSFGDQYKWRLNREYNGNAIKALYSVWVEDGNIMFEDLAKFQDVLEMATTEKAEYLDPYKTDEKTYEVYLNIEKPFNTSNISDDIVNQFKEASKTATIGKQYGADAWDKSNIVPEDWLDKLQNDLDRGTAHAWTVIPDWVTNVLKANGYDGIVDTGGKYSGVEHQVVIPFYSSQIKDVKNLNPTDNPDIRYSLEEEKGKERKHYKSIATSEMVGEQGRSIARNLLEKDRYIPVSNQNQMDKAISKINNVGLKEAVIEFRNKVKSDKRLTPDDLALGERLIQEYSRGQDIDTLNELIQDVALAGTELGQSVQALSLIQKMTPEGQLMLLQKSINRINLSENTDIKLTKKQTKKIVDSKNEQELQEAISEATIEIAEQIPLKITDKLRSWRYLSMLGNPRTHIRNILSNVAMKGTKAIKDTVAGTIEDVFKPTERTRTLKRASKETKAFAKQDANERVEMIANGGKYDVNTLIKQSKKQFNNKVMNAIAEFNSNTLDAEDKIFLKSAYTQALSKYMTANNLTASYLKSGTKEANIALTKARDFATLEAQIATFRQFSWLSTKISQIENKNNFNKVVVGGLLPFKKTPINIAKTGIDYSPIGLIKGMTYDVAQLKKGDINASKFIDNISKGLTGTSISMIGYFLAQAGILKASGDDDDRAEDYDTSIGNQQYAIKVGDKTFTIDWLSPTAMPLFVGAEFYNATSDQNEINLNALTTATTKTLNPLTEMSMLQSFASTLSSFNTEGSAGKLGDMGANMIESYIGQYFPTIVGQLARIVDDTERDTYYTDKTGTEARVQRFVNKQIAKTPFLSKTLEPRVDVWGEEVKRDDNIALRTFNQLINPSYVKTVQSSTADKEVQKLYKASEDSSVLPKAPGSTFSIDAVEYKLTPEEYTTFKKSVGKYNKNVLNNIATKKEYTSLTDAEKIKTIDALYEDSRNKAIQSYANNNKIKYDGTDDVDALISNKDLSLANAYIYRGNVTGIKSDKDSKGETIDGSMAGNKAKYIMALNTSKEQKNLLLTLTTSSKIKPTVEDLNTIGEKNYSTYYSISNAQSREKYVDLASTGMNASALNKYIENIGSVEGKKDSNGKTINGTLKTAKANYINSLSISRNEKLLLFGKDYKLSDSERQEVLKYVNSLSIGSKQKLEILSQLKGVTIKNNKVYWD